MSCDHRQFPRTSQPSTNQLYGHISAKKHHITYSTVPSWDPTASNFKPNVLDAIRMLSAARDSVKEDTLRNCFDDYVGVDKDVETNETVTEQTILAHLLSLL